MNMVSHSFTVSSTILYDRFFILQYLLRHPFFYKTIQVGYLRLAYVVRAFQTSFELCASKISVVYVIVSKRFFFILFKISSFLTRTLHGILNIRRQTRSLSVLSFMTKLSSIRYVVRHYIPSFLRFLSVISEAQCSAVYNQKINIYSN